MYNGKMHYYLFLCAWTDVLEMIEKTGCICIFFFFSWIFLSFSPKYEKTELFLLMQSKQRHASTYNLDDVFFFLFVFIETVT